MRWPLLNRKELEIYFIMGTANVKNGDPLVVLETALKSGVTFFQLREKGSTALKGQDYENFARACQLLCKRYEVPFIVNDDVELALKLNADGVHVGQEDIAAEKARLLMPDKILGVSVHNVEELEIAIKCGVDYVGIGPIYPTKSKDDAQKPAGTTFLKQASLLHPDLPKVAIGGITVENCHESIEAGADGVAVISSICESDDIQATVNDFRECIETAKIRISKGSGTGT